MNAKPSHHSELHDERESTIARFAMQARNDTLYGGCLTLVEAKDSHRPFRAELIAAVEDVYSRSTGKPSEQFEAWECGECGSAHLGRESAELCCTEEYLD